MSASFSRSSFKCFLGLVLSKFISSIRDDIPFVLLVSSACKGIHIFLLFCMTCRVVGEMLWTLVLSRRILAPNMACRSFSFFVTIKCEQKLTLKGLSWVILKFRCVDPQTAFLSVPVAVEMLRLAGVIFAFILFATDSCKKLWEAPVSTKARICSVEGGNEIVTKYNLFPNRILFSLASAALCFCFVFMNSMIY